MTALALVSERAVFQPGDYLKYGSDAEAYGSLARNRRSLSASALGRELARGSCLFLPIKLSIELD